LKALILTGRMVQDQELIYPLHRLKEAGYKVTVAAESVGPFLGIQGVKFHADASIDFEKGLFGPYDVLIIPGGVKCMEHLRLNTAALAITMDHHINGGVIGVICSGAQLLISAEIVKGKTISAYPAMRVDVENAGAKWHPGPVVECARIVSSPHYDHLGPWMAAVLKAVQSNEFRESATCAAAL
jgi:protease I